jgi:PAS domain S-box-containing protein
MCGMSQLTPKKLIFLSVVLLAQLGVRSHAAETRILFLSSYHSEFPTAAHHLEAITDLLTVGHRQIEVVYMDTKRYPVQLGSSRAYDRIKSNIKEAGKYDLILSSDDNALQFLLLYKDELAGEVPVIFFGINDVELAQRAIQRHEYAGVLEQASLNENVELAFQLFPKLGTLNVIADASASGQADLKTLQANLRSDLVGRIVIEDLSKSTFIEVAEHMKSYVESDVILFLSAYIDGAQTHLDFLESVLWLRQHTQIPVLHPYEHGIGQGFLGGKVISHYKMAQRAIQLADDYLSGRSLPENRLVDEDFNIDYFDYKEVLRYSISPSQLPSGSIVLGKPLSFFTKYKAYCIAAFIIAVLMAAFGLFAGLMYLRQRKLLGELRESEGQTASLFENSYTPILLIKPDDGRILDANSAALAYYGYTKQALLQLNIAEIDEGTFASMDQPLDCVSSGEHKSYQSKHRLRNGDYRQVEILFTCILRHQQPVLFSIVQDTTEQRRVEETLAAEQMRLLNILSGTNVGTWEWHVPSGKVCLNERWSEMLGYRLEELEPLSVETWKNLCHPDDLPNVLNMVEEHLSGKSEYYKCEFRMRHKNGSWVWILDQGQIGTCLESGKAEWMYGTHQDITELKESEAALIEAKETAEAASQAKNVFLATMSHELRTPLNPIIGFTELLLEAQNLTDEQRSWLQVTRSRSKDLLLLIEDILDIARIEAGRLAVEASLTLVQDIIDEILNFFERPSSEKGLTLHCQVAPELLSHHCWIDPTRTRQILLNLVGNAIKFSSSGEILIIAQLDPGNVDGNVQQDLHLIVRDHGPGIPQDKHELVFKEFQQIDSSNSREYEGAGLGLAICKRLAELMGGSIWIDQDYQQGAEFHVRFPAPMPRKSADDSGLDQSTSGAALEVDAVDGSNPVQEEPKHVLLVEDDQSNAELMRVCLKRKRLQVTYARDGQSAIDLCAKQRFDMILMDVKMPGMSGSEAIRILRDRGDETPVIVLTALAPASVKQELDGLQLSGFLHKPIKIKVLESMLDQIVKEQA